jgi:uncharacterized protein
MSMTEIPPAIDLLVDTIATIKSVERILLFGSRARGDDFPRADVDIAVEGADITDREWQMITNLAEAAPTLLKIDCVHLDKQKEKFLENILRDGVTLYERGKS